MPAHVVFRIQLSADPDDAVMDMVEGNQQEWSVLFREFLEIQLRKYASVQVPSLTDGSLDWNAILEGTLPLRSGTSLSHPVARVPLLPDGQWESFPWVDEQRTDWYGMDMRDYLQIYVTHQDAPSPERSSSPERSTTPTPSHAEREDWVDDDRTPTPSHVSMHSVSIRSDFPAFVDPNAPTFDFQVEYSPAVSIRQACIVLSCLLRYTPETTGSVYHLFALRRCILPVLLEHICQSSAISFDRTHLEDIMEEWLLVPSPLKSTSASGHPFVHRDPHLHALASSTMPDFDDDTLNWESYCSAGRSAGVILTGAKGVGKSTFALEIIELMQTIAPWMFTIVHKKMPARSGREEGILPENIKRCEYFEGGNFSREVRLQVGDETLNTMTAFFQIMRGAAQAGKMVVTLLDDVDIVVLGRGAGTILNQFAFEVENANFEFFLLTTSSTSAVPSFANVDISRNFHQIGLLRSLKLFDPPLSEGYNLILRDVHAVPSLNFSDTITERLRASADEAMELELRQDPSYLAQRKRLESYLHNMKVVDLKKAALQLCIHVAKMIQRKPDLYTFTFQSALEHILNKHVVLTGLNPSVGSTVEWVRHPMNFAAPEHLAKIAESIYQRATSHKQYVFFVQLEQNPEAFDTKFEYELYRKYELENERNRQYRIHHHSANSLLHQLHKRFSFGASFMLRAPTQLLPHNALHSAFIPYSAANPFNEFYWNHRNSCVVIDDLDTIIGYHEMQKDGYSKEETKGTAHAEDISRTRVIGRKMQVGLSVGNKNATSATNSVSDGDAMTLAKDSAGKVSATVALLPGVGAGLDRQWGQARAISHDIGNTLARSFGLATSISGSGAGTIEEYSAKSERETTTVKRGLTEGLDVVHCFNHPEALIKLWIALRAVRENAIRDVERLGNVVIVFYKSYECYRELVEERLQWQSDGSYDPPAAGCEHYRRNLKLLAPCCNQWVSCEYCHDRKFPDHAMDRSMVDIIQCHTCYTRQRISERVSEAELFPLSIPLGNGKECVHCKQPFAVNICVPCRMWSNEMHMSNVEDLEESGRDSGTEHCDGCNRCYPVRYMEFHRELCPAAHSRSPRFPP